MENKINYVVENGLYKDFDEDGEMYYFKDHVKNNYVKFVTKYYQKSSIMDYKND